MSAAADVDVIIPVHTLARPVGRAAASALLGVRARVRALVVCHDIDPVQVGRLVGDDPRIELLTHRDGIRSPAGPFNAGLAAVRAPYFAKLDSDDTLEPGALDAWLALARDRGAAVVMPRMLWPGAVPTPPLRPRVRPLLDPLADRLAYRTSTMGLFSSTLADRARATEGLRTGEDIAASLRLWFSGAPIAWAGAAPGYVVGLDGDERATAARPLSDVLAFVAAVVEDEDLRGLGARQRAAIVAKLVRVHLFGAIAAHPGEWTGEDRAELADATRAVCAFGDGADVLSVTDRRLLTLAARADSATAELLRTARRRRRRVHPANLLPARWRGWRRPDGAGRIDAAFVLALLRG